MIFGGGDEVGVGVIDRTGLGIEGDSHGEEGAGEGFAAGWLEHRGELEVAVGLFTEEREFAATFVGEEIGAVDEREEAEELALFVIVNQRMVVALGTLDIASEENAADITNHEVRFGEAIQEETGGGAQGGASAVGGEDLEAEFIEGASLFEPGVNPATEREGGDAFIVAAFGELDFKDAGPLAGEFRGLEQFVDEQSPGGFAIAGMLLESLLMAVLFLGGGAAADEVKGDATVQIPFVGEGNWRTAMELGDSAVDPLGEGLRGGLRGRWGWGRWVTGRGVNSAEAEEGDDEACQPPPRGGPAGRCPPRDLRGGGAVARGSWHKRSDRHGPVFGRNLAGEGGTEP